MKTMKWLATLCACTIGVFGMVLSPAGAEPLSIIGFETGGGMAFEGATVDNYYTLEFAPTLTGPWTNWGSVCEQAITGKVMSLPSPFFYRIKQTDSSAFPPYAPAANIPGSMLADGAITSDKMADSAVDLGGPAVTGTIPDARISTNVALLNGNQTFSGANVFNTGLYFGSSVLSGGGSIELGDSLVAGTPFIDFHYGTGAAEDFNVRLINQSSNLLRLQGDFAVSGDLYAEKVGIGTGTPAEALEVVGTVKATTFSGIGAELNGIDVFANSGFSYGLDRMSLQFNGRTGAVMCASSGMDLLEHPTYGSGWLQFCTSPYTGTVGFAPICRMTIDPIGQVGIGTETPAATLEVAGPTLLNGGNANLGPTADLSYLRNSAKMLLCWNLSGGAGEADFIMNRRDGATGGYDFYEMGNDGVLARLLSLNTNGVALGWGADASAPGTTSAGLAVGNNAHSGGNGGVAIGPGASAFWGCLALGSGASAQGNIGEAIAVGSGASASGAESMAIGYGAKATTTNATAIGYGTTNNIANSTRIRGNLYIDGGSKIYTNGFFGSSSWGVKAFTIDHPLDPQNKILRHFCLEGPEVWNVYAGNVQLVAGKAVVQLPDYYAALNKSGSEIYDLTAVGAQADLWIAQEVAGNAFVVSGDQDVKVSWTIKVLRNDPAAIEDLKNRPVEQLKSELKPGQEAAENQAMNADASTMK
jgi:hypothetical protein